MKKIQEIGDDVYFHIGWAELVNEYKEYVQGYKRPKGKVFKRLVKEWICRDNREDEYDREQRKKWQGGDSEEMLNWLRNGYEFKGGVDAESLPIIESYRKRARYTDNPEGEYADDLYNMGEVDYFLTQPKRESLIGLRLTINYQFNYTMSHQSIADYAQWIGSIIDALQKRGYDLEINLRHSYTGTYHSRNNCKFDIQVSKFGERVMPSDWSALFTPAGYRHLCFFQLVYGGDLKNYGVATSLGHANEMDWDIQWDPNSRTIELMCENNGSAFPADKMTKKFMNWVE